MKTPFVWLALGSLLRVHGLECPGTAQIGDINADIGGCGLEGCNARYQDNYATIESCKEGCQARSDCASFTWAPMNGDRNHQGKSACTLYNTATPNQVWGPEQIMCAAEDLLECPEGSVQIGDINADIGGCGLEGCNARYQDNYLTILSCLEGCQARSDCVSFTWAPMNGDRNHQGKSACTLYNTATPNQVWGPEQIMCEPEEVDLCADVTCEDDGDACTMEYCDPDSGECTSSDIECVDTDACTVDTCDSTVGCVFTEMACSDGNICNGEEACIEGTCVSPNDFECPSNFVCDADAGSCLRDCSLFAIDGYLNDCSSAFDDHSNELVELEGTLSELSVSFTTMDEQVTANTEEIAAGALAIGELQTSTESIAADVATNLGNIETNTEGIATNVASIEANAGLIGTNTYNIATNKAGVSANVASIASNAEDIATNAEAHSTNSEGIASNAETHATNTGAIASNVATIGGLDERVSALEERVYGFESQSDQGEGDGSNSLNGPDETTTDEEESVGIVPDLSAYHNEMIVCLVVVNVMMVLLLCCIGICYCRGEKRTIFVDRRSNKYAPVQVYSSADDEAARLNM